MVLNLIIPFIAAISAGFATTLEKLILRKRKIDFRLYQTSGFLAIALIMVPFLFFFWRVDSTALSFQNISILILVVIFSFIANVLVLYSMKWDKITHLEPAKLLEPLFTILLAILFSFIFGEILFARNTHVIIPALIAATALVLTHIKKHHLGFNKYFTAAIIGSFFFALELTTSRLILDFYSPLSFYFVRSTAIFIASFLIFRPKFKNITPKVRWEIIGASAIWIGYRVMLYYGFVNLGVIYTTLLVMLGPIFIYFFAWKILKEKLEWRHIAGSIVIIACIAYAVLG
jgi:drug/metabolite transporter (DMT)-like permease